MRDIWKHLDKPGWNEKIARTVDIERVGITERQSLLRAALSTAVTVIVFVNKETTFLNTRVQLAFLIVSCALNMICTPLVTWRLISIRKCITKLIRKEYAAMYTNMAATLCFVFDVVYIFSFAFHSNMQNLILLGHSGIQQKARTTTVVEHEP
ncbi:hypothetical protein WG66_004459 [Moniliophthora roreri]|nr:hypothetical protein WG66_004459 [Moniliophthora roreri]